jgi:hypothetical protein
MNAQRPVTPREGLLLGGGIALFGLYFTVAGFGVLPLPGGPQNLHGPLWILLPIGSIFLLTGVAILLQGLGRANEKGELPANAPQWMRGAQHLIGVTLFACFGLVGSWIAFAGESRQFSGGVPFIGHSLNITIARGMFGLGAIICWIAAIGLAVSGARKLFNYGKQP